MHYKIRQIVEPIILEYKAEGVFLKKRGGPGKDKARKRRRG